MIFENSAHMEHDDIASAKAAVALDLVSNADR